MPVNFSLRFDPSEIIRLSKEYDYADSRAMFDAGKRIAGGDYSLANLLTIVSWKSPRSKGRAARNSEADVADALRLAVSARTERAALAAFTGLRGVDVSVASAVLTAIAPDRFTIIDFRALEALGVKRPSPGLEFYLEYLAYCRHLAAVHRVSLRDLDRALWQWSKSRP